jgi:hypothetical protein
MRNWCFPRKVKNNIRLFLSGFTDGFILSKIAMSIGLYFLIGLRTRNTNIAITAAKMDSDINTSAAINNVISQTLMENGVN